MTNDRFHRMTEQDGYYTCRDCPAAGRSPMELSRIPCVPREETGE